MLTIDSSINAGLANIVAGAYWDYQGGAGGYKYGGTRGASRISFDDGALHFLTGQQTGTAGSLVPFTERLTIMNNGDVGIGTNSPRGLLSVVGTNSAVSQFWLGPDQTGNMLTIDCSINAGLANIVAGAYFDWGAGGYKYGGTRGASRIYLNDGSLHFYTGGTTGTAGNSVPFSERMTILNSGYIGIGTGSPTATLDVNGAIKAGTTFLASGYGQGNPAYTFANDDDTGMFQAASNQLGFAVGGSEKIRLDANGNVGIGTTIPQSKLAVNGTITAKEVKVTDTGWADFVFNSDYKLLPLEKVETYIKENKHLPDIPSAEEVKENGIAVSEMMARQMQKIEELTRYLIELKKENDSLKGRVSALENVR